MRWIVLAGVSVGLGFEAKMAAALMVVPALAAAVLWVAPRGRAAALRALAAGGAAVAAVGLAWPLLVWMTPAADRPWISGTSDNSIWSLILGYNGLGRLLGQDGGPAGAGGGPGGLGGAAAGPFGGDPGLLRLLNDALGPQAGWLLGAAVVAAIAILVACRLRRADAQTGWLIAVAGTFATLAVAFSTAEGIFHPYYVAQLAPFTAMLVAAGGVTLVREGARPPMRALSALAVAAGVTGALVVLGAAGEPAWLMAVLAFGGAGAAVGVVAVRSARARAWVLATTLGLLLAVPATWSVQTLGHATNGTFPAGGPAGTAMGGRGAGGPPGTVAGAAAGARGGGGGPFGGDGRSLRQALAYAERHGGATVAVSSQMGAAGTIARSGADVVALGGFSGRESQVRAGWLADAVDAGTIRWILTSGGGGAMPPDGRVGSRDVMSAVSSACTPVHGVSNLYDCRGSARALRGDA